MNEETTRDENAKIEIIDTASEKDLSPIETTTVDENINLNIQKSSNAKKRVIIIAIIILLILTTTLGGFGFIQYRKDISAAKDVVLKINNIGEISISDDVENKINTASQAYDSLTKRQQKYVSNADTLTNAKQSFYNKKSEFFRMKLLAMDLENAGGICQAFFSDYAAVWYNAIYNKTDEYNNGDFSDFNNALLNFQMSDTYTNATKTLKTLNDSITEKWTALKERTTEDEEMYKAIKDLYTAYKPMYDMASNPHGSYNSYTSETQRLNSTYNDAYAAMLAVMPSLETDKQTNK